MQGFCALNSVIDHVPLPLRQIPNLISSIRILLVAPIAVALAHHQLVTTLVLFGAAALSDAADGYLARRFDWRTELGAVLDPAADKLLLATVFVTLAYLKLVPLWLMAAAVASALVSLMVGALCVRYTRIFFGMLTLAFGMLFHSFLFKFYSITGGDQGMRVLRPLLLGMEWRGGKTAFLTGPFYYYALVLFALLALAMWRITQSPFGLHLRAIRENAGKAAYVGVEIFRMRLAAFVISAVYGGIGGTILAVTTGLADPELAYWTHSGNLVFMAVLGGSGTFAGPAIGALVFVVLQDFVMAITQYWRFVMGSVLVLLVIFMPQGLAGTIELLFARRDGEG